MKPNSLAAALMAAMAAIAAPNANAQSAPAIPGYTMGQKSLAKAPYTLAELVADPARLTSRQLDAWAQGFASWDVCDQVCGSAFLASPQAWDKVAQWAARPETFVRRAAFALLATLAGEMPSA